MTGGQRPLLVAGVAGGVGTSTWARILRRQSGVPVPLCGVANLGRATSGHWTHWLRSAYDPNARGELARLSEQNHLLRWAEAGPVHAEALVDHYWHDSGWSVSWAMSGLPTQSVTSNILAPLVTPGHCHRRLAITYQPVAADLAGDLVTREASGNSFRRQLRCRHRVDDTTRNRADETCATQAVEEEAQGAGVGMWALYVKTTIEDPTKLPDAIANVESRTRNAKLRLRRCWQHAGFAAHLGVGVYTPELVKRGRWAR